MGRGKKGQGVGARSQWGYDLGVSLLPLCPLFSASRPPQDEQPTPRPFCLKVSIFESAKHGQKLLKHKPKQTSALLSHGCYILSPSDKNVC